MEDQETAFPFWKQASSCEGSASTSPFFAEVLFSSG
jgi:hypothetical protein